MRIQRVTIDWVGRHLKISHLVLILTALLGGPTQAAVRSQSLKVINSGVAFPEGPIFAAGILYYVAYGGPSVIAWDGNANSVVFDEKTCGATSVTKLGQDLLVSCYDSSEIVRISTDGDVLNRVGKDSAGDVIRGPNDMTPDGQGGVYLTGSGSSDTSLIDGKVYRVGPDMNVRVVARDVHFANGIAVSPDGETLLVSESEAQRVIAFGRRGDGTLGDRRVFTRLNQVDPGAGVDAYPDGIEFGPDGRVWIAQYSRSRVSVVSSDGSELIKTYELPGEACPNLAFTPDGKAVILMVVYDKKSPPFNGTVYQMPINE